MGNLATPKSVQKLQTALHAKAKAEAGYRFYALYDKIRRDDILAHAYAQCRSNKAHRGSTRSRERQHRTERARRRMRSPPFCVHRVRGLRRRRRRNEVSQSNRNPSKMGPDLMEVYARPASITKTFKITVDPTFRSAVLRRGFT